MTAAVHALEPSGGVYLGECLRPFRRWLDRPEVTELIVNAPGEVWVEAATGLVRHEAAEIDDRLLRLLAEQVARLSNQGINREQPLLAAILPGGERVQIIAPSATRGHWAMAIRRHRFIELTVDDYGRKLADPLHAEPWPDPAAEPGAYLRRAVSERKTILISGGTSSGKTTFLNALLREIPSGERVILVEDTPEIQLNNRVGLGLVAVKGELGEAKVTTNDLLQAALRLRPDRIVVGELRGIEAVSFLRAINTGHPGSFSTIHANSPAGALDQLALMVMQSGLGLSRLETIEYARSVIDVIVQLGRSGGQRVIEAIEDVSLRKENGDGWA